VAVIWITYAWADNEHQDIDFIAQELQQAGLTVKLDRWNISAGQRLWDQIENFIQNPAESDAWALVATQASLGSEPCREEFAIALDRALKTRGGAYPIIGLFNGPVNTNLLPASLRVRLCVSTTDPEWKERVRAAAEGRSFAGRQMPVAPYSFRVHENAGQRRYAIEVRPRAGTWSPFFAAIPIAEKDAAKPMLLHGPPGRPPACGALFNTGEGLTNDGQWWALFAQNEATPTQSYYVFVDQPVSRMVFGVKDGQPQYSLAFDGT